MSRDNFGKATLETLAKRVGNRCSNPGCRKPTTGPHADVSKSVNVGAGAHITAASEGGPRYDASLSSEQRKSITNGIWLCHNCAKLVDNDTTQYDVELLRQWKQQAEAATRTEVETSPLGREGGPEPANATECRVQLELAPVIVVPRKPFPVLDVRLVNTSEVPALLHRIELAIVSSTSSFRHIGTSPPVTTSHVYHLLLDPISTKSVSREIAFEVPAKSTDRFQVVVGAGAGELVCGEDLLSANIDESLRVATLREDAEARKHSSYQAEAVRATCRLRIHCVSGDILESEEVQVHVHIDPHFAAGPPASIADVSKYLEESDNDMEKCYSELIEIAGHVGSAALDRILLPKLDVSDYLVSSEAAIALARNGNQMGLDHLFRWALDDSATTWYSVLCLRGLIRIGHTDVSTYLKAIRGTRLPIRLESVRMLAYLREKSAVPDLLSLLAAREQVFAVNSTFYTFGPSADVGLLPGAKGNWEAEEIVRALGRIGDDRALPAIAEVIEDKRTYMELSYELLTACIESVGMIGGPESIRLLDRVETRADSLLGIRRKVLNALKKARYYLDRSDKSGRDPGNAAENPTPDWSELIIKREDDDFHVTLLSCESEQRLNDSMFSDFMWIRMDSEENEEDLKELFTSLRANAIGLHSHNTPPPYASMGNRQRGVPENRIYSTSASEMEGVISDLISTARASLPQVKQRFLEGLPKRHHFYVTVILTSETGRAESAFIKVKKWVGDKITGTIATALRTLRRFSTGQQIDVPEREVIDWTIVRPDGSEEGNLIGNFMDQRHGHSGK